MYYEDSNQNKLAGIKKLINICNKIIHQLKHFYFSKFCTNLSKIQNPRFKCVCTCANSTMKRNNNSLYLKKSKNIRVYKNKNKPSLYLKNLPENYYFDNINNYTSFSPKVSNSNFNKICFSNKKEHKENKNIIVSNNYSNFSKSQYFYNGNENGNYSLYYFKENRNNSSSNNNSNKQIFNNNSTYYSKEKKNTAKIKLSNYKNNFNNFYHKNNINNNKNTSIIKYSTNIVSNNKKKLKEKYNYKFLSTNNFSMPKKMDKIKNITYASFYNNNNTSFNKDQKNRIFSDRVYNRSYKTILNEDKNETKYGNNNEILDQQILDYLNKNNEEKKNLIKRMKEQKIFYNKTRDEKYMLNMNEIGNNKENKNKKNKIINLNNLNNYSYVNNNYNYYCSSNNANSTYNNLNSTNNDNSQLFNNYTYNNYELLISKHNNSSKKRETNMNNSTIKSLYPNYIKNKLKKPMNKKYPLRINNFTNENIDINNIIRNESLLYQSKCYNNIRNYPYNKTFKDLTKTQFIKPLNNDNMIYAPVNYKIPLSDPRVACSTQNMFKDDQYFDENNVNAKNVDDTNNCINNKKIK